jgi:pyridoxine 5'-phosphate synthase PdxJ
MLLFNIHGNLGITMTKKLLLNVTAYCLLTFSTTHSALRAEKALDERSMNFIIVPTPREISEGCGLAVRCHCEDLTQIIKELHKCGIEINEYFQIEKQSKKSQITKLSTKTDLEC